MNSDDMKFWEWLLDQVGHEYTPTKMSLEEIEAFLNTLEDQPMSEDQIEAIIVSLRGDDVPHREPEPDFSWLGMSGTNELEELVFQLNRHRGQDDEETLRRIEELRRKALEDDESDTERLAE